MESAHAQSLDPSVLSVANTKKKKQNNKVRQLLENQLQISPSRSTQKVSQKITQIQRFQTPNVMYSMAISPKLEVPTIDKALFKACVRGYPIDVRFHLKCPERVLHRASGFAQRPSKRHSVGLQGIARAGHPYIPGFGKWCGLKMGYK
jgi:hypothetical protein